MVHDIRKLEKELYFCIRINSRNCVRESLVSGIFILVFPLSGKAIFVLNGKSYEIDNSKFLLVHPHFESEITFVSDDFDAYCIGSVLELQTEATYNIPPAFLAMLLQRPSWDMDKETTRATHAFCTMFDYNCSQLKGPNSTNIAASLFSVFIQAFYEKVKNIIPPDATEGVSALTGNLLSRFMNELRQHYKESHQVMFYADKVCVSPKYLTQVVKRHYGITPKEMIDRKLAIESMYLLSKSRMSIQEISNELNFPDQSYFGRFFKRQVGMSPLAFRQKPDMGLMVKLKPMDNRKLGRRWPFEKKI